mmetsp:Transcript_34981/g.46022  ORF Transcript_34981/g.46022 Transcript_34981/m.46022 type:complete len:547 (+) Transcript_34981:73-1713(+)
MLYLSKTKEMKTILLLFVAVVGGLCISAAGFGTNKIVEAETSDAPVPPKAVPTYYEDISPIIYNHCTKCHRPGEIGPMPLTNITEVSAYGAMIKYVTELKYMPPWKADPEYNHFLGENYLSDIQIQTIADWYDNGMQPGSPVNEAAMPNFPSGSALGTPDLVLPMEQQFEHQGTNLDGYQVFVLDPQLAQTEEIRAIEFRAGNAEICHHAVIAKDNTNQANVLDAADPNYGYEMFGGFGFEPLDPFYAVWAPGGEARFFPPEMSKPLNPGDKLLLQMHYAPTPVNAFDSSYINLFFAQTPAPRYVQTHIMSPYDLSVPFIIPPDQVSSFKGSYTVPVDISLLTVFPHMHLLGQTWESYAVDTNGDTTKLIRINDWDFNYQNGYSFENLIKLSAGTTLFVEASYDNTASNPLNPNSPPQTVFWGDFTGDEMFLGFFDYVPYQAGDENLELGSEELSINDGASEMYPIFPNPSSSEIKVGFSMRAGGDIAMHVYDINGKLIETLEQDAYYTKGQHLVTYNTSHLSTGTYRFAVEIDGRQISENFVIRK